MESKLGFPISTDWNAGSNGVEKDRGVGADTQNFVFSKGGGGTFRVQLLNWEKKVALVRN